MYYYPFFDLEFWTRFTKIPEEDQPKKKLPHERTDTTISLNQPAALSLDDTPTQMFYQWKSDGTGQGNVSVRE